jgi:hypothetical protein
MKPEPIDLLLAAGELERAAITANPARRCPLERAAAYLRELAGPIERKPVREWRGLQMCRVRALLTGACGQCGQPFMPDHSVCFSDECVRARAAARGPSLRDYEVGRSKHGRCECGEDLEHFTGPNAGGVLCPDCDSEYVAELRELNGGALAEALTIELER